MKRFFPCLLAICVFFAAFTITASATEPTEVTRAPDECGEGITWEFDDGVLTITGDGEMDDFDNGAPWEAHKNEIEEVRIEGGVTYIGACAFKNYDALKTIDFGDALYEIGREAFLSCDGLTSIELPASFKVFGESSLMSCKNLTEIHCSGRFPSFRQNCLWDTWVTIYYPAEKPWDTELIAELETAFKGRVEFLASDGSDHYEPTEAPTEPEETVPETTVPETVPPAETEPPVTEAPETEPATEAPTEPAVETQPEPTQAPTEETLPAADTGKSEQGGISTGLIIVAVVLGIILIGAVIFGGKNRRRGRY